MSWTRTSRRRSSAICAATPWAASRHTTLERLLDCEIAAKHAVADEPVVALWRYDARRCSSRALGVVVRMHPFVLHRGELYKNPFFVPAPRPAAAARPDDDELAAALAAIAERDRSEASSAEAGERIRLALEGGGHALWVSLVAEN